VALAGPARAQPAPPPLALLDVPFISQSEALCGGAAAAMVLRYWGERGVDAESFAHLVDRSAAGIRTTALIGELRTRGWNAAGLSGSSGEISRELALGRPVLTLIEDRPRTFHYVVVVAATGSAVIFHDPARAPLRVMRTDEFERRWSAADRWMAIVVPGSRPEAVPALDSPRPPSTPCDALVAEGVARAQANDLPTAERTLAAALSCPGPAPMRELAGVRLLQRRWPDVSELASAAVAIEPRDAHSWRLLGTSRFVQNDPLGALDAWNHVGEPRLDLVAVGGLVRTRQRSVERLIGAEPGALLTPDGLVRTRRRLEGLPSAYSTRVDYAPVPAGLAELRATVNERPLFASDPWSLVAIGLKAGTSREVGVTTGSLTGSGEALEATWRFWPGRPGLGLRIDSPSWGGIWTMRGFSWREAFDREGMAPATRSGGDLAFTSWFTSAMRLTLRGGASRWTQHGRYASAGSAVRLLTRGERLQGDASFEVWSGRNTFSRMEGRVVARTSSVREGPVVLGRAGFGTAARSLPVELWFAGDTGQARDVPLRAHPVLREGKLVTAALGRRIVHGSVEGQYWWNLALSRVGAALFADAASVSRRLDAGSRENVDIGVGARLAVPGVGGIFRADIARGLRDGATAISFVYEP
jgi:predicted double-glycine peptidase